MAKEPDDADSLSLQGAFLANDTNASDDGTGGSGRLNNNQLAIVATHRGADASMIARACIDDANVLPCLARKGTTTTQDTDEEQVGVKREEKTERDIRNEQVDHDWENKERGQRIT